MNDGRSPTTIDFRGLAFMTSMGFEPADQALGWKRRRKIMPLTPTGPELPYRLEGHDSVYWDSELDRITWELSRKLELSDRGVVILRVGARVRYIPVQHYNAALIIKTKRTGRGT
jgi:hypothetical protein